MDVDGVQPLQDRHTTLCPLLTALDHHECPAPPHALGIGEGLVIRHAKVSECLHQVCTLVGRLLHAGRIVGRMTRGVIKGEMDIAAGKALRDQPCTTGAAVVTVSYKATNVFVERGLLHGLSSV
jgi:hypothetical protein